MLPVALILLYALILSVAPCALRCASPPDPVKFGHIWRFSDNLLFSENLFSPCFFSFCIPKVPKAGAGSPCGKKWAIASVSVGAVVPALLSFRCCLALSACAIVPTLLCYCAFRFRLVYLCLVNRLSRSKQLCAFAQTALCFCANSSVLLRKQLSDFDHNLCLISLVFGEIFICFRACFCAKSNRCSQAQFSVFLLAENISQQTISCPRFRYLIT